jgi:hypothetical protein
MRTIMAIAAGTAICAASAGALAAGERSDRMQLGAAPVRASAMPVSATQQAMLAEKMAIATRLMAAAVDGREVTADYRMWLLESMYQAPLADLRAIGTGGGHDAIVKAVTKAAKAPAKLGAASTELVYYPITPCRYIDSRNVGGPLTAPRGFDLANTGNTYGGSAACDPKSAVGGNEDTIGALAINVAIVGPTVAPGFVGVRPAGATNTSALVNWYAAGASVQASNAGVVTTNQTPATVDEIEFFGSATQFIVDVFGVFAAPTATALDCTNGTETNTVVDATTRDFNLFANACPAGYAMVSNSCQANGDFAGGNVVLAGQGTFTGNPTPYDSNCFGYYAGSSSATIFNVPWCCRIPGR